MKWRRFNLVRMPTMHESPVPLSRKHREKVKKHHDSVAHDAEVATTYLYSAYAAHYTFIKIIFVRFFLLNFITLASNAMFALISFILRKPLTAPLKSIVNLRNRKHFPCFHVYNYRNRRVEVWENENYLEFSQTSTSVSILYCMRTRE